MRTHSGAPGLANQIPPSASRVIPSGTRGQVEAHGRRFDSVPSSARSKAVRAPARVSATMKVFPSGVITDPFGKCMQGAATRGVLGNHALDPARGELRI